jgi:hypothetical protein
LREIEAPGFDDSSWTVECIRHAKLPITKYLFDMPPFDPL